MVLRDARGTRDGYDFDENDRWRELAELVEELAQIHPAVENQDRWSDLNRHLHFAQAVDLSDIIHHDWPSVVRVVPGPRTPLRFVDWSMSMGATPDRQIDQLLIDVEPTDSGYEFRDAAGWATLKALIGQLRMMVPSVDETASWPMLNRHVGFAGPNDLRDIIEDDWPNVRLAVPRPDEGWVDTYVRLAEFNAGGSQARVFEGVGVDTGVRVAIKELYPSGSSQKQEEQLNRFRREVRSQASIRHMNIVPILHSNLKADPPYYVMPWCDTSLEEHAAGASLELNEALWIWSAVLAGLERAHASELLHRDIKPGNILRNGADWQVADFGLALDLTSDSVTMTGAGFGTLAYAAPEQLADGHAVDGKADIYALGKVLYNLTTGELPFPNEYIDLDKVPELVRGLVEQCIDPEPSTRIQTVADVRQQLESLTNVEPEPATPASDRIVDTMTTRDHLIYLLGIGDDLRSRSSWQAFGDPMQRAISGLTDPEVVRWTLEVEQALITDHPLTLARFRRGRTAPSVAPGSRRNGPAFDAMDHQVQALEALIRTLPS